SGRRFGDPSVSRVRMERGKRYPIRIELQNPDNHNYAMRLLWQAPKFIAYQRVPGRYFHTSETSTRALAEDNSTPRIPHQVPPVAYEGRPFRYRVQVTGGDGDVILRQGRGSLPAGLQFTDGLIHGTVLEELDDKGRPEEFGLALNATDADGDRDYNQIVLTVERPAEGDEEPAAMPNGATRTVHIRDMDEMPWLPLGDFSSYREEDATIYPELPLDGRLTLRPGGPSASDLAGNG
ncbi:MAG: hypothetical protein ACOCXJ_01870, partial [Planctomycetota bacterium]